MNNNDIMVSWVDNSYQGPHRVLNLVYFLSNHFLYKNIYTSWKNEKMYICTDDIEPVRYVQEIIAQNAYVF